MRLWKDGNGQTAQEIQRADVGRLLPMRRRDTHKGNYGRAAIVGGCVEYTGAPYLSAAACLRAGAGYTTLFVPQKILPYYMLKAPELLLAPLNDGDRVAFKERDFEKLLSYDSIALGMGCGASMDVALAAKYLIKNFTGRLILDADALNSLAKYDGENLYKVFAAKVGDIVLTPHCMEFSRLIGESVRDILDKGVLAPQSFAKQTGVSVLLKNAVSVLSDGTRTWVNTAGTVGQAKGGSGDVLSGVIAGLCACGLSAFDGTAAGAWLCGRAAEIAVQETGEYSLLASDTIACLGRAFKEALSSKPEYADKERGNE